MTLMTEQEQILTKVLDCDRTSLYAQRPDISLDQQLSIDRMTAQLKSGEPLQYILGDCFFFGIPFKVDARCLIPRPETEILVEEALERLKLMKTNRMLKILDIGTGSGNIAITIAKYIPECLVLSIDSSKEALDVARINRKNHQLNDRVFFENIAMEDFLYLRKENAQKFDLIISNPPYIPTEQLNELPENVKKEPRCALDGGIDGFKFYQSIISKAPELLIDQGELICEIGDGQGEGIKNICKLNPLISDVSFLKDYVGIDRIVLIKK